MKKEKKREYKWMVQKNSLGYVVYEDTQKDRIDVFPDTKEGRERMLSFLETVTKKKVAPFFDE